MQPVRAVVGANNIGAAPGSLMDVFDPAGVLIPAPPRLDSMRAAHSANYGGLQARRDFAAVGGGLLRLGGAAVGAHLDVLRREKAALDQVEALKVQLAERDAEIKRLNDIIGEMSE
jgi:hypothetical protein